jgi:nitrite reductase/ring-hydroxylating ferredoxin subunit
MKSWEVAASDALLEGKALGFQVGKDDWPVKGFLVRYEGRARAWLNSCPHAGHALNFGPDDFMTRDGKHIRCLSHGARFEPGSGICIAGPCPGEKLQRLECREENGMIYVTAPESRRQL